MKQMRLSSMDKEKEEKEGKKEGKWIGKVPKRTIEVTEEDIELFSYQKA